MTKKDDLIPRDVPIITYPSISIELLDADEAIELVRLAGGTPVFRLLWGDDVQDVIRMTTKEHFDRLWAFLQTLKD